MNSNVSIESAENAYKQILEDFFRSVYEEKSLPSHNIDHHRRVWIYAKEILNHIAESESKLPVPDPAELIIACYLHDAGMAIDSGPRHGKHSRKLCMRFLAENRISFEEYYSLLDAIEFHDRKEYGNFPSDNSTLTILSAADDLDAFGFTGIYRYLEIYHSRGIPIAETGKRIRENAAGRFANFVLNFGSLDSLVKKHKTRYEILNDFFSEYNDQAESYAFGGTKPHGFCGVTELLIRLAEGGTDPKNFHSATTDYFDDPVIKSFFDRLNEELLYPFLNAK